MGKKKQRKGAPDLDDDFPEAADTTAPADTDVTDVPAATAKKQDKKKKAKKGKAKDSGWGSDNEAAALPAADTDEEEPAASVTKKSSRKQPASAFDVLDDSDAEEAQPAKGRSAAAQSSNRGQAAPDEDSESDLDADDLQGGLVVAEVFSINPHPKSDRLKVCSVDYGHDVAQVVTNAAEVQTGMKVIFAGMGVTTPGSGITIGKAAVRGVDSFGMLCSAHDIGWSDKPDGKLVVMPDEAQPGEPCPAEPPQVLERPSKGKSSKKGKASKAADVSGDLDDPESAVEAEAAAAKTQQKGKKSKKSAKAKSSFAALDEDDEDDRGQLKSAQRADSVPDEEELASVAGTKSKKGKKRQTSAAMSFAALADDDELDADSMAEAPVEVEEAESTSWAASKGKAKKGKRAGFDNGSAFAALDNEDDADAANDLQEAAEAEDAPVTAPKGKTKKGKKTGAGAAAAFAALNVSDNDEPAEPADDLDIAEDAPVAAPKSKSKKGKRKGADAAAAFAALDVSDNDEPAEPADDLDIAENAPVAAPNSKSNKGKKKGTDAAAAFAALDLSDNEEAAQPAEPDVNIAEDAPVAAPKSKPKKGKKKGADAASAFAALDLSDNEEAAQPAEPDVDIAEDAPVALPKSKSKKGKKKGADAASAFAALGLEDDDSQEQKADAADTSIADSIEEAEDAPVSAPVRKSKKSKKTGTDAASAFAALGLEDDETANAAAEAPVDADGEEAFGKSKTRKKSKKKAADLDSVFAALDQNGHATENGDTKAESDILANGAHPGPEDDDEAVDFGRKRRKSSKPKKDVKAADIDAELDALAEEEEAEAAPPAPEQLSVEETAQQPTGKSKKKKKGKAAADTEDIDALLAELDGPAEQKPEASPAAAQPEPAAAAAPEPAADAGKGKKKKKKGKGGAKEEEEDLDAVLAELGMAPAAKAEADHATDAASSAPAAAAEAAAEAAEAGGDDDEAAAPAEEEGKEMTAAEKKKAKKKAREKAKKAGGDADDAAAPTAPAKKSGKKVSAAVRKMQEEVEARQRAEAEAARIAEETRIREEEEERRREEEERQKKEDTERRKAERLERRAQLKREGKLLTGKAKKEAERLAAVREQFLKQSGMDVDTVEGDDDKPAAKKKVVYGKKKPQPKPRPAEGDAQLATAASDVTAVGTRAAAADSTAVAQAQAEEAKAQAQQAEEERQRQEAEARQSVEQAKESSQQESSEDDWEDKAESWEDIGAVPAIGPQAAQAKQKAVEGDGKRPLEGGVEAPAAKKPEAEAAQPSKPEQPVKAESEEEEESESEEESGSEEESESESEEESSSEYSSSEEDSEEEAERRLQAAKEQRQARLQAALAAGSKENLRSPICCILGHVDTGKTKLLDNVRRTNVQDGEAGGITQQIGATYVPEDALLKRTQALRATDEQSNLKLPGLLIIDTPGHESFSNLRSRGSSLCDIAILVVDMMHGLEQQTIESINLLKMRKTPFVVALNKIDRLFDWKAQTDAPIRQSLDSQKDHVRREFDERLKQSVLNLNEQGLNVALYWKNPDKRKYVNVVPTSAITGEGLPDMLQLLVDLTQSMMASRLMVISETQCTVLEVKVIEGLGTTIDVVLVNGVLHEGDTIVLCGMGGAVVTQIRSLLTPHPLKELRVRGSYLHHKQIKAAQGVKIAAQNLETAVAGTQMLVAQPGDDIEALKAEVMEDMKDIFGSVDRSGEGVCVQASTLGSLEALLEFLKSPAVKIPVSGINIGPVHKKDIMRASVMLEKGRKKFACLLAFDVPVTREAREMAESLGVKVFTADIIYHLFDQFTAYLKTVKDEEQEAAKFDAVFPCILRILPNCVFNKKDPIVVGVDIEEGIAKVGTPLCIPSQGGIDIGRIASMELNHKPVDRAKQGESVAMKIEPANATEATRLYGRHFDFKDPLVSKISRKSIDLLKQHFKEDMTKDDWRLVVKLKSTFRID